MNCHFVKGILSLPVWGWILFYCCASPVALADALETVAASMDPTADPCRDFYRYACGGWLDDTELPEDEYRLTRGFSIAENAVRDRLFVLMKEAVSHYPSGDPEQDRIGAFYRSCMNDAGIEQNELAPLQPYFELIGSIEGHADFLKVAGQLQKIGVNRLFSPMTLPNYWNAQTYTLLLNPGDPAFADGDIYTRKDRTSKALNKLGTEYAGQILVKLGESPEAVKKQTKQINAIETVLSKFHQDYGQSKGLVNLNSPADLALISDVLPWYLFFEGMGANSLTEFVIDPDFLKALGRVLVRTPPETLKAYLRWSLISSFRHYLPDAYYRSISNELIYQTAESPRWKTCVDQTSELLGEAVGKLLVESEDTQRQKPLAQMLMSQIKTGFDQHLPQVQWLDTHALAATQGKLDALTEQIGYPPVWSDYSNLNISPDDYLANVIAARAFEFQQELARYHQPVDRNGWDYGTAPQTVNAFYYQLKNQIHLLAGLLRPPFLDAGKPDALNYAGMGYVASHEVMHGFGDAGRYFQPDGRFGELWSKTVNKTFEKRSQCVSKQYSRYKAVPGVRVNGKTTLEENLADINGLKLAYKAFIGASDGGEPVYLIGNRSLTAEQLFFVGYAQNFCSISRPATEAYFASRSWWRYAPTRFRVIGPLVNRPEFAQAFDCRIEAPMNPAKKCEVW